MDTSALDLRDLARVCRDLVWSEITAMPSMAAQLGTRCSPSASVDWSTKGLALDSLACMQLATAAATWCNAFDKGFEDLFLAKRNVADWATAMRRVTELGGKHLTFSTSGSTGTRKHIRHQLRILMDEADAWASLLNGDQSKSRPGFPVRRVVILAPTNHIYGFIWGVLLPIALKVPVIDADLQAMPELMPGDMVVAVPDQWAWLARSQHLTESWPATVKGISSTAPLPAEVHRLLTAATPAQNKVTKPPLAQLLHIYGSAETAGLAWRNDPEQPYTLTAGRLRTAANGIALRQTGADPADLAVQDELEWIDEQRFHVVGRLDSCVQVGGHNVSPAWVSAQLASHAGVAHAAIRLNNSAKPPRLKAFIVLKPAAQPQLQQHIENWASENLPWYANPGAFTYGTVLPRSSMGKLCDWPD